MSAMPGCGRGWAPRTLANRCRRVSLCTRRWNSSNSLPPEQLAKQLTTITRNKLANPANKMHAQQHWSSQLLMTASDEPNAITWFLGFRPGRADGGSFSGTGASGERAEVPLAAVSFAAGEYPPITVNARFAAGMDHTRTIDNSDSPQRTLTKCDPHSPHTLPPVCCRPNRCHRFDTKCPRKDLNLQPTD